MTDFHQMNAFVPEIALKWGKSWPFGSGKGPTGPAQVFRPGTNAKKIASRGNRWYIGSQPRGKNGNSGSDAMENVGAWLIHNRKWRKSYERFQTFGNDCLRGERRHHRNLPLGYPRDFSCGPGSATSQEQLYACR